MEDNWVLIGKIISGVKKGAYFTQLDWVQEQCMEKLGFRPYPGTLNLELSPEYIPVIESIYNGKKEELIPPDTGFCSGNLFSLRIEGIQAAIVVPAENVKAHDKNIIEVISPLCLKEALNVRDGDEVILSPNIIKECGSS
ncbi:MAG: CTP-dependent riboflavin kinase [Desulfobacterales bacterium]|nr:CTP-dependent riboflavin kinase [Desulfobacterales bacterium]